MEQSGLMTFCEMSAVFSNNKLPAREMFPTSLTGDSTRNTRKFFMKVVQLGF